MLARAANFLGNELSGERLTKLSRQRLTIGVTGFTQNETPKGINRLPFQTIDSLDKDVSDPLRIFIVEDDAVILMEIETLLEEAGHHVVGTAMFPREAIDKIEVAKPDLVFLDLRLRDGSSGLDVARVLRDKSDLTIVFVTANAANLTGDMEGAAAVISKPFTERAMMDSICFLEQCVRCPPPQLGLPTGMRLAPAYRAQLDGMRPSL